MSLYCCLGSSLGVQMQGFDALCSCHKSPALVGVRMKYFHMVAQASLCPGAPSLFFINCLAVADAIKMGCVCNLGGLLSEPSL